MGQKVAKSALKASTKQTLANVERAVASRRPTTLTKDQIERLPTSNTIRATEELKDDETYQIQAMKDQEYNDTLVKNMEALHGAIQSKQDHVIKEKNDGKGKLLDTISDKKLKTKIVQEKLEYRHKYYTENNYQLPYINNLSEKYVMDKDVVNLLLKYHALSDNVNTVEGDEIVTLGLWPYGKDTYDKLNDK